MMSGFAFFAAGLALLVIGAEYVVRGASRLALSLGISPLILGLTVVSVGTSAPELAVGITAGMRDSGSLAVGNIIGTNILNILGILGLSALIRALPMQLQILKLELPVILAAAGLFAMLAWDGTLSTADGILLLSCAVAYTAALILISRRESAATERVFADSFGDPATRRAAIRERARNTVMLVAGIGLTVLGADWLVNGSIEMARGFGMSEAVIGLTIVAIGTSAPELVTTIVATMRDQRDVAVGNLLGSSIYNILVILGITCMVVPGGLPVDRHLFQLDLPMMATVLILCIPVFVTGKKVSRLEGGIFVGLYLAYLTSLLLLRT